jgi:hypothetical protein
MGVHLGSDLARGGYFVFLALWDRWTTFARRDCIFDETTLLLVHRLPSSYDLIAAAVLVSPHRRPYNKRRQCTPHLQKHQKGKVTEHPNACR